MTEMFTIGELAKRAGVPTSTVRYYEGRGLLLPDQRTRSSYRLFGPKALKRLRFIRAAQEAGFTLANISELLSLREGNSGVCDEVQGIIEARLAVLDQELSRMQRAREILIETLECCRKPHAKGHCEAIATLDKKSVGPTQR